MKAEEADSYNTRKKRRNQRQWWRFGETKREKKKKKKRLKRMESMLEREVCWVVSWRVMIMFKLRIKAMMNLKSTPWRLLLFRVHCFGDFSRSEDYEIICPLADNDVGFLWVGL